MSMWKSQVLMAWALLTEAVLYEPCGKLLFKMDYKFISSKFIKEPPYTTTWLMLPKDWRACQKKRFVFPIESRIFQILFLFMVLHDVIFSVATPIWMWSLWFFPKNLQVPTYWSFESRTSDINKKISSSIILTKWWMTLGPCVFSLI
jgi:hypothetical protein